MFVSLRKSVEQHLEGRGVIEACEDLHDCGIRKETLTSVYSLRKRIETTIQNKSDNSLGGRLQHQNAVHQFNGNTMVCAAIRAASMLLPGGPGAQKDTLMCVPPSSLPSANRCASSAISAEPNSNTAKRRKLPSCPRATYVEKIK